MQLVRSIILSSLVLLSQISTAQTNTPTLLSAARANGSNTSASFSLGLSLDNGSSYQSTALSTDNLRLIGTITPEASQVGQKADVYVVAQIGGVFYMRNQSGAFIPWNGLVPTLVPFRFQETLTANHAVDFLTGKIPIVGSFALFMGYKASDGILTYTKAPLAITITAPVVVPPSNTALRDQAVAAFKTNISSQIVQSRCIACHFSGGEASGAGLLFVFNSNTQHLTVNFSAFETFTKKHGREFILSRVRGINHDGGEQLSASSQDYKNLDSFLQLIEQL